jgi:hypothetical protein
MKLIFYCLFLFCLFFPGTTLLAQAGAGTVPQELRLGTVTAVTGGEASLPLHLTSNVDVQGLVAVFEWPEDRGEVLGITPGAALANAELVSLRADPGANFAMIGVVVDVDGDGGEVIPAGADMDIATTEIRCTAEAGSFAVRFVDSRHAFVDGGPVLQNELVVDGQSILASEGLVLTDGRIDCLTSPPTLKISGGMNNPDDPDNPYCGDVQVLLTNDTAVDGLTLAVCSDPDVLRLESIGPGKVTESADFFFEEIFENGGTVGIILNLEPPLDLTIEPGEDQHVATYRYCCIAPPEPGNPAVTTALEFCDLVIGNPAKENLVVIDSQSVTAETGLVLENGEFLCQPRELELIEICDNEVDDDKDGLVDCADPDCTTDPVCRPVERMQVFACGARELGLDGEPQDLQGSPGSPTEVCFFLDNPLSPDGTGDAIQGFTMAMTFCCDLLVAGDAVDITGTILDDLQPDFLELKVDNDPDDGDGCELVFATLIETLPPFNGDTIPAFTGFQRMGCVSFTPRESAACGECCELAFVDGINGNGNVPVKNLVSIEGEAYAPLLRNCEFCIADTPRFFRGDCNFSQEPMGMAVDIADAASIIAFLRMSADWVFEPQCADACDCDDSGSIDIADALCVLQFVIANQLPPAPGPGIEEGDDGIDFTEPGVDPTADKLDCAGGGGCADGEEAR